MRLCAVGDTVRQGQLLVSGYEDYGLFIRPVCASAEIYARTWHTGTRRHARGCGWKSAIPAGSGQQVTLIVGKKKNKIMGKQ